MTPRISRWYLATLLLAVQPAAVIAERPDERPAWPPATDVISSQEMFQPRDTKFAAHGHR